MARRNKLESANETANAFIGIATLHRDYKLVHYLNVHLGIELTNEEDLPVYNSKSDSLTYFPFFSYHHPDLRTDLHLIANNSGISLLVPSLKQISYFLLIQGAAYQQHIDSMIASIRKIPGVQAALSVNQSGIKEMASLMEDLELHLIELKKKADDNNLRIYKKDEE